MSEFRAYDIANVSAAVARAAYTDLTKHHDKVTELLKWWRTKGKPGVQSNLNTVLEHLNSALTAMEGINKLIVDMPLQLERLDKSDETDDTQKVLDILRSNRGALETAASKQFIETTLFELKSARSVFRQAMSGSPEAAAAFTAETNQQIERILGLATFTSVLVSRLNADEAEVVDAGHRSLG